MFRKCERSFRVFRLTRTQKDLYAKLTKILDFMKTKQKEFIYILIVST